MFDPETKANNAALLAALSSDDSSIQKEGRKTVREFLKIRAREDGFLREFIPEVPVTPDDLTPQVDTNRPTIVLEKEPNSAGASSMPFGRVPNDHYMDTEKYRCMFDRIMSFRYTGDVALLATYTQDLRQAFNDLMLKDILDEEDRKFLVAVDAVLGAVNTDGTTRVTNTGAYGYVTVGSLNRVSLAHARKGLGSTDQHLPTARALINCNTIWDVVALGRDTIGGDKAEQMFLNGWSKTDPLMGIEPVVTIKTDLVEDDIMYQFTSPDALGDFLVYEPLTVWTKHEAYMFEMFAYETISGMIGNDAGACKVSFTESFNGWRPSGGSSS